MGETEYEEILAQTITCPVKGCDEVGTRREIHGHLHGSKRYDPAHEDAAERMGDLIIPNAEQARQMVR